MPRPACSRSSRSRSGTAPSVTNVSRALSNSMRAEIRSPSAAHASPSSSATRAPRTACAATASRAAAARSSVSAADASPSPTRTVPDACAAIDLQHGRRRARGDDAQLVGGGAGVRQISADPQDVDRRGQQRRSFDGASELLQRAADRRGRGRGVAAGQLEQRQAGHRLATVAVGRRYSSSASSNAPVSRWSSAAW